MWAEAKHKSPHEHIPTHSQTQTDTRTHASSHRRHCAELMAVCTSGFNKKETKGGGRARDGW